MRWLFLGSVCLLAVGVGLVAGLVVGGPSRSTMAVSTQPREDQIPLGIVHSGINESVWGFIPQGWNTPWLALDTADYPSAAVFRLEVVVEVGAESTGCVRLFDLTADAGVAGSELCASGATLGPLKHRLRSGPMTMPAGEHEYTLQGIRQSGEAGSALLTSRIIVEWNESLVMGPGPNPVGGMVGLLVPEEDGGTASHLPPAALAMLVMGAGGLYVVKMRRG